MPDKSKISFFVNQKDYELLLAATEGTKLGYGRFVKRAKLAGGRYQIRLTVRQLEAFAKFLHYEKKWWDYGPQRTALRAIVGRLQGFLRLMRLMGKYTNLTT